MKLTNISVTQEAAYLAFLNAFICLSLWLGLLLFSLPPQLTMQGGLRWQLLSFFSPENPQFAFYLWLLVAGAIYAICGLGHLSRFVSAPQTRLGLFIVSIITALVPIFLDHPEGSILMLLAVFWAGKSWWKSTHPTSQAGH